MRRLALSLVIGALSLGPGCDAGAPAILASPVRVGSGARHVVVAEDGRSLTLRRGEDVLLTLGPEAFQIGTTTDDLETGSFDPWAVEQRGEADVGITFRSATSFRATAEGAVAHVELGYETGLSASVRIEPSADGRFAIDFVPSGPGIALARIEARTSGDPREGFYGLGEQLDSVDQRGKLRAMQIEVDTSIESANNEAHVPVPLLLGTRGWGMFVESRRAGTFDVARKDPAAIEATFAIATAPKDEPRLRVWLFAEDRAIDLVRHYHAITSRPRVPPAWVYGPLLWRNESRDQREVMEDIQAIRALDLATSGIWVDRPYATAVNTFDFDPARYTDAPAMIARAHAAGLRFALWSTPYLEEATGALRSEAIAKGFFPPQNGVLLNKWGVPIDFTNPAAFAFWTALVDEYTSMGVDGFKLDFAEDVVPALGLTRNVWRFADGSDERTMHHGYSGLYHRAYDEPLASKGFLLCRAAHWGEQSSGCVIWPGDVDATFTRHRETFKTRGGDDVVGVGGLPATIVMGLSLGASGFPFFGADTGGYRHAPPDAELWVRWVEQTALSTVMQVGDASSQPPWVFTAENGRDASSVDVYRTYARLHARLFPYVWSYAERLPVDGRPIQRPLGLAHPELGVHPDDAYLMGDDLLVAPVVVRGERQRTTVLPAGDWYDWWDGTRHGGGSATIDAPLDKLPLLMRQGAIVPMLRPTIDTLAPAEDPAVDSYARDPGVLWVRIAPGPARRFELWDGTSIERDASGAIKTTSGSTFSRGFVLELIATPEPAEVLRDGVSVAKNQGWTWEPAASGTLRIELAGAGIVRVR